MKSRRNILILLFLFLAAFLNGGELTIRIRGIDFERGGQIKAGLYASEDGFLDPGSQIAGIVMEINGASTLEGVFRDLPQGRYVVAVLHDEDGDDEMDTGFLGIPKEGYGFSGVEEAPLGPPKFDKAAVSVGSEEKKITEAEMKYL